MALVSTNKKGMGYFNSYILRRIEKNKNFLCCITGGTGSGKSYSALRECSVLDEDFDVQNVCFTPVELMNLINGTTKQLKKGSCILYDEVQVSHGHLDYRSIQSKLINYLLQTFRHRNFILFMTSPHFSFINASARKLFHCRMETQNINTNLKLCRLKPFLLQVNQNSGKVYQKYLRVVIKGQGVIPLKSLSVRLPDKVLLDAYEEKKTKFTDDLNRSISKELDEIQSGKKKVKPLTSRQNEILKAIENGASLQGLTEKFGIVAQTLKDHLEYMNKKLFYDGKKIVPLKDGTKILGYKIEEVKQE